MKVLDMTGVQALWNEIKAYVAARIAAADREEITIVSLSPNLIVTIEDDNGSNAGS